MAPVAVENTFNPWQKTLIIIVLSLLTIFGFLGNLAVCITFNRSKRLQTSAGSFIVNLAIADTLQCINMVFMITAASDVAWFRFNGLCLLNAFANVTFIGTSILSLTLISINRYFVIVKGSNRNTFTRRKIFFFMCFVWLIPAFLGVSPMFGWCKYEFRPGHLSCLLAFRASISFMIIFFITFLCVPFAIMSFCSWKIITTIRRNKKRMKETASVSRKYREERRITTMLFVVIISFLIFYTPISTVNIIEVFCDGKLYEVDPSVEVAIIILTMLNHVNNPIIYGLLNRNCRRAFLEVFCWKNISLNS